MFRRQPLFNKFDSKAYRILSPRVRISSHGNLQHNRTPTPPRGNWFSTEPGSSVDIVKNPIGQRHDNRHGGEETEGKGWNQAVVSYTTTTTTVTKVTFLTNYNNSNLNLSNTSTYVVCWRRHKYYQLPSFFQTLLFASISSILLCVK